MNELKIFNNEEFGRIRAVEQNGEPWFVGKDVAEALGYSNSRKALSDHVDKEDKGVTKRDTLGGTQEMTIINESGLYSLVLSSKLPTAKKFKRWVTSEVIPSIRKHGAYLTDQKIEELLISPDTIINLATQIKEEREKNKVLAEEVKVMKPKAQFADAVNASPTASAIGDLAKLVRQNGVDIGRNRMFEDFRNWGFLHKNGISKNMPTQKAMDMGLFEVKETVFMDSNGVQQTKFTPRVTGKGQIYFLNKYLIMKEKGKAAEA
ncbi:BRO family protein [Roseburia hominis]|uniref:BRO family protein n=1 Tax=Roseburia hominis TaxID=301301 RepID=UPI00242E9E0B|nr:BRO family protein [Roseburia hominis]